MKFELKNKILILMNHTQLSHSQALNMTLEVINHQKHSQTFITCITP
jgi:cobalamin biosynthesis Co2+ chelatase CbiK